MFTPPYRPLVPKGSYDQYGGGYTGGYAKDPGGGYGPRGPFGFGDKQILGPYGKRFFGVYNENHYGPRPVEKPYFPHPGPHQNYYNQDQAEEIHCSTCDIWCYGIAQYNAHARGSKHQKQIKEEKNKRAVSKMPFIKYDALSNTYECTYCGTALNSCSVVVMHIGGLRHQEKAFEIEGPPKVKEHVPKKLEEETKTTPEGVTVTTIGDYTTYHCKECNVSANSETQMAQHLASQRHLAKDQWKPNQRRGGKFKAHWVAANGGEGPPTYKAATPAAGPSGVKLLACEVCNVMVNSAAQMAQHTASLRHKNNLAGIRYEPYVKTT